MQGSKQREIKGTRTMSSTASVLMAGTVAAANTSRIPYASMSYLEIFYDYCVSGVDFSLPGNGGKESPPRQSRLKMPFVSRMKGNEATYPP